jgi:hypothetical protein
MVGSLLLCAESLGAPARFSWMGDAVVKLSANLSPECADDSQVANSRTV